MGFAFVFLPLTPSASIYLLAFSEICFIPLSGLLIACNQYICVGTISYSRDKTRSGLQPLNNYSDSGSVNEDMEQSAHYSQLQVSYLWGLKLSTMARSVILVRLRVGENFQKGGLRLGLLPGGGGPHI